MWTNFEPLPQFSWYTMYIVSNMYILQWTRFVLSLHVLHTRQFYNCGYIYVSLIFDKIISAAMHECLVNSSSVIKKTHYKLHIIILNLGDWSTPLWSGDLFSSLPGSEMETWDSFWIDEYLKEKIKTWIVSESIRTLPMWDMQDYLLKSLRRLAHHHPDSM